MVGRLFPIAVAVCEAGAAMVYWWQGEWRLAVIWTGYAAAAVALAWTH
jgi:hypothetical protein